MMTSNKRSVGRKGQKHRKLISQVKLHRRLKSIFQAMGMTYIETEHKELTLLSRKVELDFVLIYKNIVIIGEETTTNHKNQNLKEHVRKKEEAFQAIDKDFDSFIEWLKDLDPEVEKGLREYQNQDIGRRFVYCSMYPTRLTQQDKNQLYSDISFMEPSVISYFQQMSKCLKHTEVYEFLHFLGLKEDDIGSPANSEKLDRIKNTIITPETGIGLTKGVRVVSFMMSAGELMKAAYVLRKDSWNDASSCYQRLIKPSRLNKIRSYLAIKKSAFINNIIVALPDGVQFFDSHDRQVDIFSEDDSREFKDLKMTLPISMNSICIIDGQHRVFAHYEAGEKDRYENEIASLREKRYLLVTGLVFDPSITENRRLQIQSQLFLDINQNTQKVPQDVTLQIRRTAEPLSDVSIATNVLEEMNQHNPFIDKFEFSSLSDGQLRIKTTSIILYGLKNIVSTHRGDDNNLYKYWRIHRKQNDLKSEIADDTVTDYSDYCSKKISTFFDAVKQRFLEQWEIAEGTDTGNITILKEPRNSAERERKLLKLQRQSKLFSVVSINGFIMCFGKLISETGLCTTPEYEQMLQDIDDIDFSAKEFSYTASQYARFSEKLISDIKNGPHFKALKAKKGS